MPREGEEEGGLGEGEVEFIQTRVVVFLKHWLTQGFLFFLFIFLVFFLLTIAIIKLIIGISDETVKDKIRDFIQNDMEKILPEKNLHLCATLNRLLDEQSGEEQNSALFGNAPKSKSFFFLSFCYDKPLSFSLSLYLTPPTPTNPSSPSPQSPT